VVRREAPVPALPQRTDHLQRVRHAGPVPGLSLLVGGESGMTGRDMIRLLFFALLVWAVVFLILYAVTT
jgi:hypothetical protein